MTEYDYSPEAVEHYKEKQRVVGRWVAETQRHHPQNPFTHTPSVRQEPKRSNTYTSGSRRPSSSSARPTPGSRRSSTDQARPRRSQSRQPHRAQTLPVVHTTQTPRAVAAPQPQQQQVYYRPQQVYAPAAAQVRRIILPVFIIPDPIKSACLRLSTAAVLLRPSAATKEGRSDAHHGVHRCQHRQKTGAPEHPPSLEPQIAAAFLLVRRLPLTLLPRR
ncbi:hypothetical protein CYLTODRAFT_210577 [Cylindrobasidium torrendii FP15055 ss-10]|uniref:Uncharacterized protein n=1 Tax=Cylindrobasidium torrendii FP15055 ss-10 TaxID=1314674 RepID=A0A0D7BID8_9AGAR|nr:hypothetical protein CYLTODRAFT_210577 [Cylindrobasidium torrendii FP15055 ss-10]